MGKQEYKFSDSTRFGQLPKVERKVITKMTNRGATRGVDHTAVCTGEIGAMLACFEGASWRTGDCLAEIATMHACVEEHKGDPVRVKRAARRPPPLAVADGCARAARPHAAPLAAAAPQDPRVMAKQWQGALRQRVFQYFAKQRVLGRIR